MAAQHFTPLTPEPNDLDDLAAKILRRTESLTTDCAEDLRLPYRQSTWRKTVLLGFCTLAVTGLLGGAVYLVGAPPEPDRLTAGWPVESTMASGLSGASAEAKTVTGAAAKDSMSLTGEDLAELRESGWSCPDLGSMGFSLSTAEGSVLDGVPTVKLTLAGGGSTVTVYERHPGGSSTDGPVNPLTGHAAAQDGFQPLGDGKVWLNPGNTWQAVLSAGNASYLLVSDLPPTALKPATAALASAGTAASRVGASGQTENWSERLMRGLSRILTME